MQLRANYHTHTTFCDGRNSAEEMVQQAIALGFTHLGFSGHMDQDVHMDLPAYYAELRRLREVYGDQIDILIGIELDNLYDPHAADEAEYVIGSTHYIDTGRAVALSVDDTEEIVRQLIDEDYGGDAYRMSKAYYELEAQIVDKIPNTTFIGHFDLVTRFNDAMRFLDESDPRYYMPALEAMEYLVTKGRPFEINCGAVNRGRKAEFYPNTFLLRHLREMGGEIVISSDAHQREFLNGAFDAAVTKAIECGFSHTNVLVHDARGQVVWRQMPLQ